MEVNNAYSPAEATLKKLAINVFSNTRTYQYLCPQKQEFKVLTDAEETDGELVVG